MINRLAIATHGFRGNADDVRLSIATRGFLADNLGALDPAGNYTHLWKSLAQATTHDVSIPVIAKARFALPEAFDLTISAISPEINCGLLTQLNFELPFIGAMVSPDSVICTSNVHHRRPRGGANTAFVRGGATCRSIFERPEAGAIPVVLSIAGKTHYAFWTPETIQNLTEEMILTL